MQLCMILYLAFARIKHVDNSAISRRRLLQGAGAMWLLGVSQSAGCRKPCRCGARTRPASSYTRVTQSRIVLPKYKQFALGATGPRGGRY